MRTCIISDNIALLITICNNLNSWMHDPHKRNVAMLMLNEFDRMTYNQYWLTDDEELFINHIINTIESYC